MTWTGRSSTGWPAKSWGRDALTGYVPMLATTWPEAFDDADWWFEIKWDGYRCLATTGVSGTRLRSRRGLDLGGRFPEVAALELPTGWVFDGEVVAFDDEGRPNFSLLQAGRPANYVVFDVLESPEGPLLDVPLEDRRTRLHSLHFPTSVVVPEPMREQGKALFGVAAERGLEGIIAKRSGSPYQPGRRSPDWRKITARHRMRAVVGGWLPGDGGRRATFASLLVGLWDGDDLRWVGAVGSGFTDQALSQITRYLGQIELPKSPFVNSEFVPRAARWVEPRIVVHLEYKEWTRDLRLRAPVFKGVEPAGETARWEDEGPG